MIKALKIILVTVVCLVLLVIIGGYVALTQVDFNRYKGMITEAVYNATGRKLELGDIQVKPSFNPRVEVKNVSFSNAKWAENPVMASAESIDVGVAVFPLFAKRIVIDTFQINNAVVNLEEKADGRANWTFEAPNGVENEVLEKKASFKFELVRSAQAVEVDAVSETGNGGLNEMLSSLVIKQLAFENVKINYTDKSEKTQSYDINSLKLDENDDENIAFGFRVNGGLYSGEGVVGALGLLQAPEGYPVKADVNAMGINVAVTAELFDVLGDMRFDGKVIAKGFLGKDSGYDELADVSAKGDLSKIEAVVNNFTVGGNKITGTATAVLSGKVPVVTAELQSDEIDISTLSKQSKAAWRFSLIREANATTMVSADNILYDVLYGIDGGADVTIAQIVNGNAILVRDLALSAKLNDGVLKVKLLNGKVAEGNAKADMVINAENQSVDVNANITGLNLMNLMKTLKVDSSAFNFVSGSNTDLSVMLSGKGRTYAAVAESLDGQIVAIVDSSVLHLGNVGMMKGNIISQLFNTLNLTKGNDDLDLKCAVIRADLKNGLATFPNGIVLNADKFTIVANGDVNLKNDKIGFSVKPFAGKLTDTNIAKALSSLVKLGGTLQSPSIGVDSANAIKTIVGVTTSGPVYLGAQMLLENDGSPCYTALAGTGYETRFPKPDNVVKGTTDDVGKILDDSVGIVKDTTKGLLNLLSGKNE